MDTSGIEPDPSRRFILEFAILGEGSSLLSARDNQLHHVPVRAK